MAYTVQSFTESTAENNFFVRGPILKPTDLMTHIDAQKVCIVSQIPDETAIVSFIQSIQEYGSIRFDDYRRSEICFNRKGQEIGFWFAANTFNFYDKRPDRCYASCDLMSIALLVKAFALRDRKKFGDLAKSMVKTKAIKYMTPYFDHDGLIDAYVEGWNQCRPYKELGGNLISYLPYDWTAQDRCFFYRDLYDSTAENKFSFTDTYMIVNH